jgi:predicted lipoprotein with Yx(FWY)xxD motif
MRSAGAEGARRALVLGILASVAILFLACGGIAAPGASAAPSAPTTVGTAAVATPALGEVLVDSHRMPLYVFHGDEPPLYLFHQDPTPSCYEACAEFWPPLLTTGTPRATGAVDAQMLGTITREDGTTQVTYAGHPLYRCTEDTQSGEANGDGVEMFDDGWYAIGPGGYEPSAVPGRQAS